MVLCLVHLFVVGGRLGSLQEFKILSADTKFKNGMLLLTSSLNYLKQNFKNFTIIFLKNIYILNCYLSKLKKWDLLGTLPAVLATTNVKTAVEKFLELLTACNFSR